VTPLSQKFGFGISLVQRDDYTVHVRWPPMPITIMLMLVVIKAKKCYAKTLELN